MLGTLILVAAFQFAAIPASTENHVRRDHRGRIARSPAAIAAFKRRHPCPATSSAHGPCPGYVVDHINPLACGGDDRPDNMQWQTIDEAREKDKWERKSCATQSPFHGAK